ncbi:MAG: DoxX family protein [Tannerella sp.]|jgi:uncharacterized membrane protein YphA (DoxX/SURF4 family)|nr:DoxX family protein [Tannerella sp.]
MLKHNFFSWEKTLVTLLRMAIGWHFLYEGVAKIIAGNWSSQSYLANTSGFLSPFYHCLASSSAIGVVDWLNIIGLTVIGLALFMGFFTRWATLGGVCLLTLYYFAYPPFGVSLAMGVHDGSVFVVDKLFIEATALAFLFFSKDNGYGLDALIKNTTFHPDKVQNPAKDEGQTTFVSAVNPAKDEATDGFTPSEATGKLHTRREALKNLISLPVLGGLGVSAYFTGKQYGVDAMSGATVQVNRLALSDLKGELPKGKIGNHQLSRLIMGGNLIGGWAHARDLLYAGSLFKAYNTEKKVFETLMLGEQAGINCINIGYPTMAMMKKYKKVTGSKIKVIVQVGLDENNKDIYDNVTQAVDHGMDIIQLQGNWCDWLVRDGRFDNIAALLERIRSHGLTAGMGAHTIDSLIICEEKGILPDYYMKTMHHDNYWSAHPRENRRPFEIDTMQSSDHNMFHDNCFCPFPDRTVEFVNSTKIPVMGFKVLAAGAIAPEDGFKWALGNGADFICVGMFDFQIVHDVNVCLDTLAAIEMEKIRKRPWA